MKINQRKDHPKKIKSLKDFAKIAQNYSTK